MSSISDVPGEGVAPSLPPHTLPPLHAPAESGRDLSDEPQWICLRTHPKREHIAMAHLRQIGDVEVFGPRIRYEKITRRGKVWFTEALFPCYVFARLRLALHQRVAAAAHGVSGIVRFGTHPCIVPAGAIDELRAVIPDEENVIPAAKIEAGTVVVIGNPLFLGLRAVVTQVIPARQRIKVLLDFLGRCSEIEISTSEAVPEARHILAP